MRILFALSGFHRYDRGAETALLAVAEELARNGDTVTVAGSGEHRTNVPYEYVRFSAIDRTKFEKWPSLPALRNEMAYEDATFAFNLARTLDLKAFDLTLTCGYPYTNWALRRGGGKAPPHIFVTENGDWPAYSDSGEYRFFGCDGLVCTNPEYFERNRKRWPVALIPNGIFPGKFAPGPQARSELGLPSGRKIVLMVSAFMDTKRVPDGIRAVSKVDDAVLVVAGDGPLRAEGDALAAKLLPDRYHRITLPADKMPDLYRSADAFLHMSKKESFGNVYVEAAASGLPVVAHDTDLTRWILGDEQYLCDTENLDAVAASIQRALDEGQKVPSAGLDRFSWPKIALQYREFFEQTLARQAES